MKIYILFFLIICILGILIKNNNIEKREILFYKCNKYSFRKNNKRNITY